MYTENGTQRSVAQRSIAAWEFSTVPLFAVRLIDVLIKHSEMMEMVIACSIAPLHYSQSQILSTVSLSASSNVEDRVWH